MFSIQFVCLSGVRRKREETTGPIFMKLGGQPSHEYIMLAANVSANH